MSVLKGIRTSFIVFAVGVMIFYIAGRLSKEIIDLGIMPLIWLLAIPAAGGITAGYHSMRHAWRNGFLCGILIYFFALLAVIWFIPELLFPSFWLISFGYCIIVPICGALFGFNIYILRPEIDENGDENEEK